MMRNVVLADRLAAARGHKWAVIAAFADGKGFPTAKKVRSGQIGYPSRSGASLITPLSYQLVIQTAKAHSNYPADWDASASWVERKITVVGETRRRASA